MTTPTIQDELRSSADSIEASVFYRPDEDRLRKAADRIDRLEKALRELVWVCDDPNGSESGKSLAFALSEKLPDARAAFNPASDK